MMEKVEWFTKMTEHLGQKLAIRLRHPSVVSESRKKFKHLLVLTQRLSEVRQDGLPDPDYNESRFRLESELIQHLETDGQVVLIETFAGKRIFYAYVGNEIESKSRATQVLSKHNQLSCTEFRGGSDPDWQFYSRYLATVN